MISKRQEIFYTKILIEIVNANIDLKSNGYLLKANKNKEASLKEKINAYNLFFKSLILSFSTNKNILQLNNYEFNDFIEKIRVILAENKYILKIDEESFTEALIESKKTTDFNYFLKKS